MYSFFFDMFIRTMNPKLIYIDTPILQLTAVDSKWTELQGSD